MMNSLPPVASKFPTKTLVSTMLLICALAVAVSAAPARGLDPSPNYQFALTLPWASHSLDKEVNNLNRMRGQVRWQFRNYKSTPEQRRDYFAISHDIDEINSRFKQPKFDKRQLRKDVEHAHTELHRIELSLKVKARDYFLWK